MTLTSVKNKDEPYNPKMVLKTGYGEIDLNEDVTPEQAKEILQKIHFLFRKDIVTHLIDDNFRSEENSENYIQALCKLDSDDVRRSTVTSLFSISLGPQHREPNNERVARLLMLHGKQFFKNNKWILVRELIGSIQGKDKKTQALMLEFLTKPDISSINGCVSPARKELSPEAKQKVIKEAVFQKNFSAFHHLIPEYIKISDLTPKTMCRSIGYILDNATDDQTVEHFQSAGEVIELFLESGFDPAFPIGKDDNYTLLDRAYDQRLVSKTHHGIYRWLLANSDKDKPNKRDVWHTIERLKMDLSNKIGLRIRPYKPNILAEKKKSGITGEQNSPLAPGA